MKTQKFTFILFALLSASIIQGCVHPPCYNSPCTSGFGEIISSEFLLDNFTSIANETVVKVEVEQGDEQRVVVEGYENLIDEIDLRVINGKLRVDMNNGCYNNINLSVFITVPTIEKVAVESTGNIILGEFEGLNSLELLVKSTGNIRSTGMLKIDGTLYIDSRSTGNIVIEADAFEINSSIDGTGNISLTGNCTEQYVETSSTGGYNAYKLYSDACTVYSNGIGAVKVNATNILDATVNSIGNVYYKGNPENVSVNTTSLGKVIEVE
jgi:hypothetical protein